MKICSIVKLKLLIFTFTFFFSKNLLSHHKIYSPKVEEGRQSLEWRGHFQLDNNVDSNKSHHHVLETEYSWNDYWQSEIEFHISDKSDSPLDWEKTELQNQIQIYESEYLASAIYFSYNFNSQGTKGDEIEYKFLNEFSSDSFSLTTNFIFEKEVISNPSGSTEFSISNYYLIKKPLIYNLKLGLIGFSEFGNLSKFEVFQKQEHNYGFQFENEFEFGDNEYEFSIGYLNGLTHNSNEHILIWNFEIEI